MSSSQASDEHRNRPAKKLRMACNACHHAKSKCGGGNPCSGCIRAGHQCIYSQSNRVGRPKGTKNKRNADLSGDGMPQQARDNSGEKSNKRVKMTASGNENIHNNNDLTVPILSSVSAQTTTPLVTSQQQNNLWSEPQVVSSLPFNFGTDNNFLNWPNTFNATTVGELDYPFNYLTTDTSMDFSGVDFTTGSGIEGLQYGLRICASSNVATVADLEYFPHCTSTSSYIPKIGQGVVSSEVSVNRDSGNEKNTTNSSHDQSSCSQSTYLSSSTSSRSGTSPTSKFELRIQPTTPDSFGPEPNSTSPLSSPLEFPMSTASLSAANCLCLQYHAKLLVRLKDLWRGSTAAPIDVVLNGVQQALTPWNHYLQCRTCQLDEDQEVLTLSAMSIRAVLRLLQSAYADVSPQVDVGKRGGAHHNRQRIETLGGTKFAMGSYEITGEDRMLVLELLLSKTLSKIQLVLGCLKKRSSRQGSQTPSLKSRTPNEQRQVDGIDIGHLQTLLQNLESTVQVLSTDLMK
jgi:Fungal Zn(2)-Cys(6) binuclear cluster domain